LLDPCNAGSAVCSKKLKEFLSIMKLESSDSEVLNLLQGKAEITKESLHALIDGFQFDKEEVYMDVYR
jgi:succinate dehydrogenase flavin-adding protein (antitoxin of CptAB toxin-antitoxin module)